MSLTGDQRNNLRFYLLEKIKQKKTGLSRSVAEEFHISQTAVHNHINDLVQKGIIKRIKRDTYELVRKEYVYDLSRQAGDLDSDIDSYNRCLASHIKEFPKNVIDIWSYAFSEMINNVMDHSMAEKLHIIIRQDYLETQVILIDDGVGIFEKIRDHFGLASLDDAISELFKGKLTTDEKNHSGEGIFFTSKLMDDFFIISDGKVFTNNRYDISRVGTLPKVEKGTGVFMELSNFSHKNSQEVFDLYSDVDGGFTKTRIPLKNMFDSSPVSRSQAKRVCNRLNKFKEVEFDFDGIQWMGQGFAHQIFVVFQNDHPDINLIPINMNETVTKMLKHVIS